MSQKLLYFAYGSNMSMKRLLRRVPSARCLGTARLAGKRFAFNKKSEDGSAKANMIGSPGCTVWGVLYEIDAREIDKLDRVEGGYERIAAEVTTDQGQSVTAQVYVSQELTQDPRPYSCYKELVIGGAIEQRLPEVYIEHLREFDSKEESRDSST